MENFKVKGRATTYDIINGIYTIKVEDELADKFLTRRDSFRNDIIRNEGVTEENATRRADCEFPEYALEYILPPEKYQRSDEEIFHEDARIWGSVHDFKVFAQAGISVGPKPQIWVKENKIDFFTVFKWGTNNHYKKIEKGNEYTFEVIGSYFAQFAVNNLYKDDYRKDRFFTDKHPD